MGNGKNQKELYIFSINLINSLRKPQHLGDFDVYSNKIPEQYKSFDKNLS